MMARFDSINAHYIHRHASHPNKATTKIIVTHAGIVGKMPEILDIENNKPGEFVHYCSSFEAIIQGD